MPALLTETRLQILHYLIDHEGEPLSQGAISEKLGVGLSTTSHALATLRKSGFIDVQTNFDENGGQLANSYKVSKNRLEECLESKEFISRRKRRSGADHEVAFCPECSSAYWIWTPDGRLSARCGTCGSPVPPPPAFLSTASATTEQSPA